ncbi:hypothetical protein BDD12DRAFT_201046 [Trichophaea hybrida]|nr:hypothetical protein BDD12DRAFT_201046 [Trichophaea hybrida]
MAPINHLTKRDSLGLSTQPLSKAMIGAIAGGATFIILFIIGLGVFIYFYVKSSQRPDAAHLGPDASQQSSTEDVIREKTLGDSDSSVPVPSRPPPVQLKLVIDTPPPSTTTSPNPNAQTRTSTIARPKKTHDRRSLGAPAGDQWNRHSRASNNSLEVPATPGNEFV